MAWAWEDIPAIAKDEVLSNLKRRARWLDGITVTGGEPTCTPGLEDLLADLKTVGLPIKLDSNGSSPVMLRRLLQDGLVQTIAIDIKGPWRLYPELTGGSMTAEKAMESLVDIFGLAKDFPGQVYFRCTKVPLLAEADLKEVSSLVPAGETLIFQDFVAPK
jgi:pyruvate formate lyase activating enzyme